MRIEVTEEKLQQFKELVETLEKLNSDSDYPLHMALTAMVNEHINNLSDDQVIQLSEDRGYKVVPSLQEIMFGDGKHIISTVMQRPPGIGSEWAGFCVTKQDCSVGEKFETNAEYDTDLGAFLRIVSTNPVSLDMIIKACEHAKKELPKEK